MLEKFCIGLVRILLGGILLFLTMLTFTQDTLDYIVDKAVEFKLGARGLRSIVETIMMDAMFEVPSTDKKSFEVTKEYAETQMEKRGNLA